MKAAKINKAVKNELIRLKNSATEHIKRYENLFKATLYSFAVNEKLTNFVSFKNHTGILKLEHTGNLLIAPYEFSFYPILDDGTVSNLRIETNIHIAVFGDDIETYVNEISKAFKPAEKPKNVYEYEMMI